MLFSAARGGSIEQDEVPSLSGAYDHNEDSVALQRVMQALAAETAVNAKAVPPEDQSVCARAVSRQGPVEPVPEPAWNVPGFGPLTRISTSFGEVPAQALRLGDKVRVKGGALKTITWLDRIHLEEGFMASMPSASPVLIRKDALGWGMPVADVLVSPYQLIEMPNGRPAQRAYTLTERPLVMVRAESLMTYTLFHCGGKDLVHSEGLWMPVMP